MQNYESNTESQKRNAANPYDFQGVEVSHYLFIKSDKI